MDVTFLMSCRAFLCREQSPPRYMLRRIDDPAYELVWKPADQKNKPNVYHELKAP
jgi:hypothetical protein